MAEEAEVPTNTPEFGCFTDPHTPAAPAKKGSPAPAPDAESE